MEVTQANVSAETSAVVAAPRFESYRGLIGAYPGNKRRGNPIDKQLNDSPKLPGSGCLPRTQAPTSPEGVSNCYVFKSRLQEYSQKVGLPTPTYETIREGPSHEPSFKSTVIVGGARYDSLLGFYNRKAAEQSAAEVALMDLSASGKKKESISIPVHETGLCKNVLQEYAQKMNYAIPTYTCKIEGSSGRLFLYSCTVDIGGIQYIGTAATTKKEAEIKAARTALLAIESSRSVDGKCGDKINYTVLPLKRKAPETPTPSKVETPKPKKSKRSRVRNKRHKKKDTPTGDQKVQVEAVDDGQNGNCVEKSAQVNEPTKGEGDVDSGSNATQLTVTISQQDNDVKTIINTQTDQNQILDSSIEPAESRDGSTAAANPMLPGETEKTAVDDTAMLPNSGDTVTPLTNDDDVDKITPSINTQTDQNQIQILDSSIEPVESRDGSTAAANQMLPGETEKTAIDDTAMLPSSGDTVTPLTIDDGVDKITPSINTQTDQNQILDSSIEPVESRDGSTAAANPMLPGETEKTAIDDTAMLPSSGDTVTPSTLNTQTDQNQILDSSIEPAESRDGSTAAANPIPMLPGETEKTAIDAVTPCSDLTVNDVDSDAQG